MGAELSCDVCNKVLNEDGDDVHEKKGGEPEHVCDACFNPATHAGYTKRSVYSVCGEENARRMNANPQNMRNLFASCSNTRPCPCGAETVVGEGVTACFACEMPFET